MSRGKSRKSIFTDMTAMCDMAFLLLTFFILTAQMKPKTPIEITLPSAIQSDSINSKNSLQIAVEKQGRVYLSIADKNLRKKVIENLNDTEELVLSRSEMNAFQYTDMFGFSFKDTKSILSKINNSEVKQLGIPTDTTGGELKQWLITSIDEYDKDPNIQIKDAKGKKKKMRIIIRADKDLPYKHLKKVLEVVQSDGIKIDDFEIVTVSAQ